ncbi:MAG TPA: ferric reductase-like transmembrane domain-containing protein [Solirubrobacterales bacterium]
MNVEPHLFWITSRAAGGAALLASSASVALGLMISAKGSGANKRDLRALHEALSLTALAMVALHGAALLGDAYLRPGLTGITVPFAGSYRPLWTGLGIVAGYGLAALGLTYYCRDRIGAVRWRRIHRLTGLFWLLAVLHTIRAGSDAAQLWFLILSGALVVPAALLLLLRWLERLEGDGQASGPALDPRTSSRARSLEPFGTQRESAERFSATQR